MKRIRTHFYKNDTNVPEDPQTEVLYKVQTSVTLDVDVEDDYSTERYHTEIWLIVDSLEFAINPDDSQEVPTKHAIQNKLIVEFPAECNPVDIVEEIVTQYFDKGIVFFLNASRSRQLSREARLALNERDSGFDPPIDPLPIGIVTVLI